MLLDDYFPKWDFSETHSVAIRGERDEILRVIKTLPAESLPLVNVLMKIRTLPSLFRSANWYKPEPGKPVIEQITGSGFILLGETSDEILLGIIGKFWRPAAGICLQYDGPGGFREFHEPGWAKAGWNFHVAGEKGRAVLTTQTRILATDAKARRLFRFYWAMVRPGSGLIRSALLRKVKQKVEALH